VVAAVAESCSLMVCAAAVAVVGPDAVGVVAVRTVEGEAAAAVVVVVVVVAAAASFAGVVETDAVAVAVEPRVRRRGCHSSEGTDHLLPAVSVP